MSGEVPRVVVVSRVVDVDRLERVQTAEDQRQQQHQAQTVARRRRGHSARPTSKPALKASAKPRMTATVSKVARPGDRTIPAAFGSNGAPIVPGIGSTS